jgi:hypothetical protein
MYMELNQIYLFLSGGIVGVDIEFLESEDCGIKCLVRLTH